MSKKPKVYVSRIIPEPGLELLYEKCEVTLHPERDEPPSRHEFLSKSKQSEGVLVLLTEKVDAEFIDNAKELRAISTYSVGLDHVDVGYATTRGIIVAHTPNVLTEATADYAFGLMLAASRRIVEGDKFVRSKLWNKPWSPYLLVGNEASGATLGIVGMGRIGKAVARRALGFGMKVTYFDRKGKDIELERKMKKKITFSSFHDLLKDSDFISVHVPLGADTFRMFGDKEFSMMKKSAVFVNTSRGGVVDSSSLCSALKSGKIFAAALDVFEKEPIEPSDPLLKLNNVVLSPHLGSASHTARSRMAELAALNLIDALHGRIPKGIANPQVISK